jgi:hypothetical protein
VCFRYNNQILICLQVFKVRKSRGNQSSARLDRVGRESDGWFPLAGSSLGSREELARRKVGVLFLSPGLGLRLFSIRVSRALTS